MIALDGRLNDVRNEMHTANAERRRELQKVKDALTSGLQTLQRLVVTTEQRTNEETAHALPVIVAGIVLSGRSPELASHLWLGVLFLVAAGWVTGLGYARTFGRR